MKIKKIIFTLVISFFGYTASVAQQFDSTKMIKKNEYTCSMHPEVISNTEGYCPKCGMQLIKKESEANSKVTSTYTCSMHPEVILDNPGKCPKCGMNLILKVDGTSKHKGCMGMMNEEKGHPKRMMYLAGGAVMIVMMTVMMLFVMR